MAHRRQTGNLLAPTMRRARWSAGALEAAAPSRCFRSAQPEDNGSCADPSGLLHASGSLGLKLAQREWGGEGGADPGTSPFCLCGTRRLRHSRRKFLNAIQALGR